MGATATISPRRAMFKIGTYVGDGVNDRNIDIGVNLFKKYPAWLMVKAVTAREGVWTIFEAADSTSRFDATANFADGIEQMTTTGFEVGQSNLVNELGVTYYYVAFWYEG